jgi:ankyrin repeat protein
MALLKEGQFEKSGGISSLNESSFSAQLVNRGSSPDAVDDLTGNSLLHISAEEGFEVAGMFLASHGAQPNRANRRGETPLHKAAGKGLAQLTALLLKKGGDPNAQTHKDPSISLDIEEHMKEVSTLTREVKAMSPDVTTTDVNPPHAQPGAPPVQFDLPRPSSESVTSNPFDLGAMVQKVASLNPFDSPVSPQAPTNPFDSSPEASPSSNPRQHKHRNLQPEQTEPSPAHQAQQEPQVDSRMAMVHHLSTVVKEIPRLHTSCKTPLHLAIQNKHKEVVKVFLQHKANTESSGYIALDVNVMDGEEQTALGLALWSTQLDMAEILVAAGADVESRSRQGLTLLLQAILRGDADSAGFLLQKNADYSASAFDMSPLFLAIHLRLPHVVKAICRHGANTNKVDQNGDPPLWVALSSKQEDLATILIQNRCDSNVWHMAPGGYLRTLLHRAIEIKDSAAANFLIRNGADFSRSRQGNPANDTTSGSPPPNTPVEAKDKSTPLHMATASGLDLVVQTLMEHQADVNARDSEGRSPIHIAILNKHHMCIHLLMSHPSVDLNLKDRNGHTPFAAAMAVRDNDAANTILSREPNAAHQIDTKGYSFMHTAIQRNDVESVVFLMSVGVSVNTRLQNATELTPLHMAVEGGSEIICRHLLLAGADVHATNHHKQTPLHIAASCGQSAILSILLENGADPNALDDSLNNALHVGVYFGHLAVVKTLLLESNISVDAVNMRGQTSLHMLGEHAKDNAAVIFETMLECVPTLNVNAQDALGNTALLLAYMNGASNLSRALIKAGAHAGIQNRQGVTIFNAQVATKMLLWRLLDMIPKEPEWLDGNACQNCGTSFGITTRKHHCRHCGRLLDSKCCSKQMPLIKFGLMKPVRVCNECWDILTSANK